MHSGGTITEIESSLGFRFALRSRHTARVPALSACMREVDDLRRTFSTLSSQELRASPEFHKLCDSILDRHGAHLWPPDSIDRSEWLVDVSGLSDELASWSTSLLTGPITPDNER